MRRLMPLMTLERRTTLAQLVAPQIQKAIAEPLFLGISRVPAMNGSVSAADST
jgi:hypothetical protein